jgi:hypothetical protein
MAEQLDPSIASKTLKNRQKDYDSEFDEVADYSAEPTSSTVRSVPDLVYLLEKDDKLEIEANVMCLTANGFEHKRMDKKEFVEAYKTGAQKAKSFRESVDGFALDFDSSSRGGIGQDFIPLLGGPFNKQLYLYDMLKMMQTGFHYYNHNPIAKLAIEIIHDFSLGRGFRIDCKSPSHLAVVRAFEEVNNLQVMMSHFCKEMDIYGEDFIWWLPDNATYIGFNLPPEQRAKQGLIPRVRLVDPSVIWEIVSYPEDITRVLYYQWVAPTQYQIYTGTDAGRPVPSTKFIFQQVPSDQMDHYKINCQSNEKRGRSSLFPVFSYLKRLKDSVDYSIIGLQKTTAWSLDTEIDGNQTDIDNYVASQQALGTIAPPGSEFVHSTKVKRSYMANDGASRAGGSQAFDWAFSMVCAGLGIPMQYFGTHLSGQGTRGNAIIATEPVAKKFEMRQQLIERVLKDMMKKLFKKMNMEAMDVEVTFPEVVVQDRNLKLKDLALAENMKWFSHERIATMVAKEFSATDFEWEKERLEIDKEAKDQALTPAMSSGMENPFSTKGQGDNAQNQIGSEDRKSHDASRGY